MTSSASFSVSTVDFSSTLFIITFLAGVFVCPYSSSSLFKLSFALANSSTFGFGLDTYSLLSCPSDNYP